MAQEANQIRCLMEYEEQDSPFVQDSILSEKKVKIEIREVLPRSHWTRHPIGQGPTQKNTSCSADFVPS